MMRSEVAEYINEIYSDFRNTMIHRIRESILCSKYAMDNGMTLYGNRSAYVNDECDGVVHITYNKLFIDEDNTPPFSDVMCEMTKDNEGVKKTYRMNLNTMPTEMIVDMVQNM